MQSNEVCARHTFRQEFRHQFPNFNSLFDAASVIIIVMMMLMMMMMMTMMMRRYFYSTVCMTEKVFRRVTWNLLALTFVISSKHHNQMIINGMSLAKACLDNPQEERQTWP